MTAIKALPALEAVALTKTVRQALGLPAFQMTEWRCTSLPGHISNPATGGLYRVTGTGQEAQRHVSWSLILKIAHLTEEAPQGWGTDLLHFGYWKRETLAYQSGFLENLGSYLKAPRCFEVTEQPDGSVWMWLEEIRENGDTLWPMSRYGLAARHFGQWQGTYLAGRPLPAASWLKTGWLRSWIKHFEFLGDFLLRPQPWEHPFVQMTFPVPFEDRLRRLWAERHTWMDLLDRLPQTLCHFDIWRSNLMARQGPDGQDETVALDWQCMGLGPAGELGNLVMTSLMNLEEDASEAKALDLAVWENYLAGLREAGWRGDARAVRFCYTAYPALRWGLVFPLVTILPYIHDTSRRSEAEAKYGEPFEQLLTQWASAFYFLLDLADEARCLADRL